jgi:hypothetical protein
MNYPGLGMEDFVWLLKSTRRIESFLLPLFPRKWRNPPPSYQLAVPVIGALENRKEKRDWISPLLYTIRKEWYQPYHKSGLATAEMSDDELRWMRWVSAVAVVVVMRPWAWKTLIWDLEFLGLQ